MSTIRRDVAPVSATVGLGRWRVADRVPDGLFDDGLRRGVQAGTWHGIAFITAESRMSASSSRSLRIVVLVMVAVVWSCADSGSRQRVASDTAATAGRQPPPAAPIPPKVADDLRALRWIDGTWRGTGEGTAAFYERYRLIDDSTLVVESLADSTRTRVSDTTRFLLRGGALTSVPGGSGEPTPGAPRWFASALGADSARFEPLSAVRNTFVWRRGSSLDAWEAELRWPATATRPARRVVYAMRRLP